MCHTCLIVQTNVLLSVFVALGVWQVRLYSSLTTQFFLFFVFFGTVFDVLTVVMIHNAVWVRTPCSLVHGWECFGEAFCICLHKHLENEVCRFWQKPQYLPVRVHSPITLKTIILNLNILHFTFIVSLLQTDWIHVLGSKYTLLFYSIFWCEETYVRENIM